MVNRVEITPEAAKLVEKLRAQHGPLLFHQSGGCCDGSAPMCYPAGEFRIGPQDVFLGYSAGGQPDLDIIETRQPRALAMRSKARRQ